MALLRRRLLWGLRVVGVRRELLRDGWRVLELRIEERRVLEPPRNPTDRPTPQAQRRVFGHLREQPRAILMRLRELL